MDTVIDYLTIGRGPPLYPFHSRVNPGLIPCVNYLHNIPLDPNVLCQRDWIATGWWPWMNAWRAHDPTRLCVEIRATVLCHTHAIHSGDKHSPCLGPTREYPTPLLFIPPPFPLSLPYNSRTSLSLTSSGSPPSIPLLVSATHFYPWELDAPSPPRCSPHQNSYSNPFLTGKEGLTPGR